MWHLPLEHSKNTRTHWHKYQGIFLSDQVKQRRSSACVGVLHLHKSTHKACSTCYAVTNRRVVLVLASPHKLVSVWSASSAMWNLPLQHWKMHTETGDRNLWIRSDHLNRIWSDRPATSGTNTWSIHATHIATDLQPVCIFPGSHWTVWTLESELRISSCNRCSCESSSLTFWTDTFFS